MQNYERNFELTRNFFRFLTKKGHRNDVLCKIKQFSVRSIVSVDNGHGVDEV